MIVKLFGVKKWNLVLKGKYWRYLRSEVWEDWFYAYLCLPLKRCRCVLEEELDNESASVYNKDQ